MTGARVRTIGRANAEITIPVAGQIYIFYRISQQIIIKSSYISGMIVVFAFPFNQIFTEDFVFKTVKTGVSLQNC